MSAFVIVVIRVLPCSTENAVEVLLIEEVNRLQSEYQLTKKTFASTMADIPSGLPDPDGQGRIRIAGKANSHALDAWVKALEELNRFWLEGSVPEWIVRKSESADAAR